MSGGQRRCVVAEWSLEGDLVTRLNQFGPKSKRAMVAGANITKTQAISHMRSTAPWTDRTGAARSGLNAEVQVETNAVALILFHSVAYGIYLEVRWGGKYAVIRPALGPMSQLMVSNIGKLLFR